MKKIIQNILLSLTTFLLIFCFFEFFVVRPVILPQLPLRLHHLLHHGMSSMALPSKSQTPPKDYIMIVGDSHAQGMGDWYSSANRNLNSPYASHNTIFQETGIDTLAFGYSGEFHPHAYVSRPIDWYEYLKKTWFYSIPQPRVILAYFYEGNDVYDNIIQLEMKFKGKYNPATIDDPNEFRQFLEKVVIPNGQDYERRDSFAWYYNFVLLQIITNKEFKWVNDVKPADVTYQYLTPTSDENHLVTQISVDDSNLFMPDNALQGPPVWMSEGDIQKSLFIFRESIKYIQEYFNESEVKVVYLPSSVMNYNITSDTVQILDDTYDPVAKQVVGTSRVVNYSVVKKSSDTLFQSVKSITDALNIDLIDTRSTMQAASAIAPVHGPIDWNHFNQHGYETIAKAIKPHIKR